MPYSFRMRRATLVLLWILTDGLLFIGAYALAYGLKVGWLLSSDFPFDGYLQTVALITPVWLLIMIQLGVYKLMRVQRSARNLSYLVYACLMGAALFTLTYYFLHGRFFSRLLLVEAFSLSVGMTVLWHLAYGLLMRLCLRAGAPVYPTLLIGTGREAKSVIALLQKHRSPLTPVAVLDSGNAKEKDILGIPVLGKLNKLEETIGTKGITHLIQTSDAEHTINLLSACRTHGVTYVLLPSVLGIVEHDEHVEQLEGRQVTVVHPWKAAYYWFFS